MKKPETIEEVTCIHGDCIKVMDEIPGESIDMVFTDPPYLMGYQSGYRSKDADGSDVEAMLQKKIMKDTMKSGIALMNKLFPRLYRVMKQDSFAFICFKEDGREKGQYINLGGVFRRSALKAGFDIRNTIQWVKNNWSAGDLEGSFGYQYESILLITKGNPKLRGKRHTDIWEFDRVADSERIHPNQKPTQLIARAIKSCSNPDDKILDCFGGSGSTAIAAHATGRKCVLIEADDERYEHMVSYMKQKVTRTLF